MSRRNRLWERKQHYEMKKLPKNSRSWILNCPAGNSRATTVSFSAAFSLENYVFATLAQKTTFPSEKAAEKLTVVDLELPREELKILDSECFGCIPT